MKYNNVNNATVFALICSAMALLAAVLFVNPSPAPADFAIKDHDFQIVSATITNGNDALYILDSRSGQVAVFQLDQGKALQAKAVLPVAAVFGQK